MKNLLLVFTCFFSFCSLSQEVKSDDFKSYSSSLDIYTNEQFENYFLEKCESRYDEDYEAAQYTFIKYIKKLKEFEGYKYYITIFTNSEFRESFISQLDNRLKNKGYLDRTLILLQNIEDENLSVEDINRTEKDDYYGKEIAVGEAYLYSDYLKGLKQMISPLQKKRGVADNWEAPFLYIKDFKKGSLYKIGQTNSQKCGQDDVKLLSKYIGKLFSEEFSETYDQNVMAKLYQDTLIDLRNGHDSLKRRIKKMDEKIKKMEGDLRQAKFKGGWTLKLHPIFSSLGSTSSLVKNSENPAKFKFNTSSFQIRFDYVKSDETKSKKSQIYQAIDKLGLSIGYQQGTIVASTKEGVDVSYEIERENYSDIIEIVVLQEDVSLKFNCLSIGGFYQDEISDHLKFRVRTDFPLVFSRNAEYLVRNGNVSYSRRYVESNFTIENIPQHGLYNDVSLVGQNNALDSKLSIGWSVGGEIDYVFGQKGDSRFGITGGVNFFLMPVKLLGTESSNNLSDEYGHYSSFFQNGTYLKTPRLNFQLGLRYSF